MLLFSGFSKNPGRFFAVRLLLLPKTKSLYSQSRSETMQNIPATAIISVTLVIFHLITHTSHNIPQMLRRRTLLLLLWVIASPCLLHAKQLAVVTDTANKTTNLTAAELIKLFNAHVHTWADGKPVIIVVRDPASADMDLVLRKIFNMSSAQARAFIEAHKPSIIVAGSDDAVLRFVSTNRGAIGIVDLYSLTKDVNVIKINGKLPVEQGYLLRGN
jgi:hypothetical protein